MYRKCGLELIPGNARLVHLIIMNYEQTFVYFGQLYMFKVSHSLIPSPPFFPAREKVKKTRGQEYGNIGFLHQPEQVTKADHVGHVIEAWQFGAESPIFLWQPNLLPLQQAPLPWLPRPEWKPWVKPRWRTPGNHGYRGA